MSIEQEREPIQSKSMRVIQKVAENGKKERYNYYLKHKL